MKIENIILSEDAKEKILKMALALFTEYSKITFGRNGMVKFFRRGLFKLFPKKKIHYLELCLESIPRRMSLNRYGNTSLTKIYYQKIASLIKTGSMNYMVDYLWEEILKVRIIDPLFDLNSYVIPLESGYLIRQYMPDTRVISQTAVENCDQPKMEIIRSGDSIIKTSEMPNKTLSLRELLEESKVQVASVIIFATLNLGQLFTTLHKSVEIFPNSGVHSFLS